MLEKKIEALIEATLVQEEFTQGIDARKAAGKRLEERRKSSDKKYTGIERRKALRAAVDPKIPQMQIRMR